MNLVLPWRYLLFTSHAIFAVIWFAEGKFTKEEQTFHKEAVRTHNVFRAIHLSPALKLDLKLTKRAKKLADEAAKLHGFYNLTTGENIFESTSTHYRDISGKEVTESWFVYLYSIIIVLNNSKSDPR